MPFLIRYDNVFGMYFSTCKNKKKRINESANSYIGM